MSNDKHIWNFATVGGVKRVKIESGNDLKHLHELDQKLWTALSCPIDGLEFDNKTLLSIDTDGDRQIRVPEVLQAVNWTTNILKNADDLLTCSDTLKLDAINTSSEEGLHVYNSAKSILKSLGKPDAAEISIADTQEVYNIFIASKFNGDGIITTASTEDEELITAIQEIFQVIGSVKDLSGLDGIDGTLLQSFKDACNAYYNWINTSITNAQSITPLGSDTEIAYNSYKTLRHKIDDYFLRCQLASFDTQTTSVLNLANERVATITDKNMADCIDEISAYPIAKIEAKNTLHLTEGINPAWIGAMQQFKQTVTDKMFPNTQAINMEQWEAIKTYFAPYESWLNSKEGASVESLGIERVTTLLQSNILTKLEELISNDAALANEANNITTVDKFMHLHRDLFTLLNNYVSFFDFYSTEKLAIFQAGTLYIDQRSCDLCIKVNSMDRHNTLAPLSGMYLMYCECKAKHSDETMIIAVGLTNGDIDNLIEGRNAVFYDREGKDWDARIIKIIDNPISIKQAFWSPYRKVSRFIETQINKFAAAQDEKVTSEAMQKVEKLPENIPAKSDAPKQPAPPFDIGKFVGIFAAISLALGAIGSVIASIVGSFFALTWWKMPLAIAGVILAISGPAMIIAYLKLRKRNLAPLLDANGWAINAGVIINIQFGRVLTHLADLPIGANINFNDPFQKKQKSILPYILFISLIAGIVVYFLWKMGILKNPF